MQPVPGGSEAAFDRATVRGVMRPGVMTCQADAPLVTVARVMAAHNVHAVVVGGITSDFVHGDQLVWGVISDMDLIRGVQGGIRGKVARDVVRTEAISIEPTASLLTAAALMSEKDTAHLVVADAERPVGIISTLDLAGALARADE